MPQFDVEQQLQKDEIVDVTLADGTKCQSVVITPKVRRELRKIDRELTEKTVQLRRTQQVQAKTEQDEQLTDADIEEIRHGIDVIDDVQDGVYRKLVLLLEKTETGGHPSLEQVQNMGDRLAGRLFTLITEDAEGNVSQPETLSPAETTTTN